MSVYFIAAYDIENQEQYQEYVQGAVPLLMQHGGEVLVAGPGGIALEGNNTQVHVLLRFESEEAAMGWYNDPAYQAIIPKRQGATSNGTVFIAPAFVPPSS